ncbi:MAG TPA: GTPase HflX [Candidatus Marinimicrobia bacterium]|nr:GTPase HflX [Candidatus Neomarinimicrobiota bacterium]
MIEPVTGAMEKAITVGVILPGINESEVQNHLDEMDLLADTAGAEVVGRVTQRLSKINPSFFVGKGKAEQIINQAKMLNVNLIIFDNELSPAQIKNYHKLADDIKIIDRSGLILDIFQKHAQTREAKTQVELAFCQYLLPRLTRQWTHLERQMGGIGTRAGMGETQIEIDRRLIRNRISKLKKDLKRIDRERETQSQRRKNEFRVALVGYTNAGKSTLFNALTGADVHIQDQLFATLDTTIRQLDLGNSHQVLLSDTVGFIRKLPHNLVASFRSTLKEVLEANLVLMVLDASSSIMVEHLETIRDVLSELGAGPIPEISVLNKIDLITDKNMVKKLQRQFPDAVAVSALQHLRLNELRSKILRTMENDYETVDLQIPYEYGKIIAQVQDGVEVLERVYDDQGIRLKIRGNKNRIEKILKTASAL